MEKDFRVANYFIGYVATIVFLGIGAITTLGMGWYQSLVLPLWMPPTILVAVVWAVLFLLTAWSACIVWDKGTHDQSLRKTVLFYMANALLVLIWNYLFFGVHLLLASSVVALLVGISVIDLMYRVRRIEKRAMLMLVPYLIWMPLALYFSYIILSLNP